LTKVWGNNSLYVESEPGKGDFHCLKGLDFGEMFRFWGNQCYHYNEVNDTGSTRVSFDFRVIPYSKFQGSEATTVKSGLKFEIGSYFDLISLSSSSPNP